MLNRYIEVKALMVDNELIPLWDKRINYVEDDFYGSHFRLKDDIGRFHYTIDCIFNLKDKKLYSGIELIHKIKKLEFNIGEQVHYEIEYNTSLATQIVDVEYTKFSLTVNKGKDLEQYLKKLFPDTIFDDDTLYSLKIYEPTYILRDGEKVDYVHKLKHIKFKK